MATGPPSSRDPNRPLRADAERNRQRILSEAGAVFAAHGLDVSMDEIARHVGVGVGTLYRRFPTKELLIDALFEARIEAAVQRGREAMEVEDPWEAFVAYVRGSARAMAADRGLKQLLLDGRPELCRAAGDAPDRIRPLVERLVARARRAGVVRPDLEASDVLLTLIMVGAIDARTQGMSPGASDRALAILLAGMSATADGGSLAAPPIVGEVVGRIAAARLRP